MDTKNLGKILHKKGVILDINEIGCQMIQLEKSELIGVNFFSEIPDAPSKTLLRMMHAGNEKPFSIRIQLPHLPTPVDVYIIPESKSVSLDGERLIYFKFEKQQMHI